MGGVPATQTNQFTVPIKKAIPGAREWSNPNCRSGGAGGSGRRSLVAALGGGGSRAFSPHRAGGFRPKHKDRKDAPRFVPRRMADHTTEGGPEWGRGMPLKHTGWWPALLLLLLLPWAGTAGACCGKEKLDRVNRRLSGH